MQFQNSLKTFTFSALLSIFAPATVSICRTSQDSPISHQESLVATDNLDFSYSQAIKHRLVGSSIITQFAPKNSQGNNIKLNQLAIALGYDHFNWVNYVEKDPYGIRDNNGQLLTTPYNDPPIGGYQYDGADKLPFYWDLVKCNLCQQRYYFQDPKNSGEFAITFQDSPADYRLKSGEAVEFITNLVGVKNYDSQQQTAQWEVLYTFRWQLTNTRSNYSQVSLIDANVNLSDIAPPLLTVMQLDGAIFPASGSVANSTPRSKLAVRKAHSAREEIEH